MRVLIVEDHVKMAGLIQRGLRKEGMAVDVTGDGEEALWMAEATEYDAIILDVMLPGVDGFEVCRELRSKGVWAPILMLTARDAVRDRVAGLDSGADDYLTKPFSYAELLARLRALVRRGPVERPAELEVGDLRLDPARRQGVARRHRDPALAEGVLAPRDLHATPRRGALALPAARARVGLRVREPLQRRRLLHPPPAQQDRPAVRHHAASRRCAAPATACERTAASEPHPDQAARHAGVRRGHGDRARRDRALPVPAPASPRSTTRSTRTSSRAARS